MFQLTVNFVALVIAFFGAVIEPARPQFLVFQLSVNLVAMLSAAVGAIYGGVPPLNVLQLLWVNMIMDTLAALALATENPYPELLNDKPHGRTEPIITGLMYLHILAAAAYKLLWLFLCLYALPRVLDAYAVLGKDEYYRGSYCYDVLSDNGFNSTVQPPLCKYMGYCGFPRGGGDRQTAACPLYGEWITGNNSAVPGDERAAVCRTFTAGTECPWYKELVRAKDKMDSEYERDMLKSYKPALSVLFNSFILAQAAA
ncbi:Plasma membrane calcium-transporting ATPase 1 [Tetrabaena socialis]|uniref:Plasma membrane calcium-transporting ATPase 1 n=1 Tax=Tetrabaena socialis TaxID=47790 RepID=A0A2J8AEG9_9CHLO|nr:Plasma membrane calcium-transporting ATPase 1 [Tetrabaena socialis]|eukprot:PNH10920.1 Plasma membrane calcium-transporting ATPase 1 [Tetrabaena socialis]